MLYPFFDPVALSIGPLRIHWYGLMYLFGFLAAWFLGRRRAALSHTKVSVPELEDLMVWGMFGVVVGGRVGYVLAYNFSVFLADPLELFRLWHGGMSFHGGLCGVLVFIWLWSRRHGRSFWDIVDFVAPLIAPGLFFGRIGNFINNELWGAPTTLPWGMAQKIGDPLYHPSQLYEAVLEGLVLFVVLWWFSSCPRPRGQVAGLFAILYAVFRAAVEFVRLPDAHIGYLAFGWLTMGQLLCVPLFLIGVFLLRRSNK